MSATAANIAGGLRTALATAGIRESEAAARTGAVAEATVLRGDEPQARPYLHDQTESRAIHGRADAVVIPADANQVAAALAWCYAHDVPLVPRGGGTGFAGGAVPRDGGVVLSLEKLAAPPSIDPGEWRAYTKAGVITAELRRRVREQGLYFPPDPGAAESSTIGGNIATNAGGPHTFKYGVTGTWVSGLEVVLAPGELVAIGGPLRKDVAGYDLRSLLIGSEGTLGIVTGAWLKLIPAPELALPVMGLYAGAEAGCAALANVLASGIAPAALEFLDAGALRAASPTLAAAVPALETEAVERVRFMVIADVDGGTEQTRADAADLAEVLSEGALDVHAPAAAAEVAALWRWREGVSLTVIAQRGGKLSEDIVVPFERLGDAIAEILVIGERHGLDACSWGHAGDGNIHATFMIDASDPAQVARAEAAAEELFELAARLGGSVSGEHGLGFVKNGALALQWPPRALDLHTQIKRLFDPKNLLNPDKKLAR